MEKVWPPSGICVKITQKLDRNGNKVCTAVHKRDSTTTYRLRIQTGDAEEVLGAWMNKFTGISGVGLTADFEVVARGSDHEGYYYVLVPTAYN
jgi:hypothetical protein